MTKRLQRLRGHLAAALIGVTSGVLSSGALAQDDVFAEYREMMGDDNPAEFVIEDGLSFWEEAAGSKNVALAEVCDLGLGVGVVDGAYAQLPRYFADADAVQDAEERLVYCMVNMQGVDEIEAREHPYSSRGEQGTRMEAMVTYIASASNDVPVNLPQEHPQEKYMYSLGEELFFYRAGPHDFSCATCHRQTDKRIRLQALPNLTTNEGAGMAFSSWPAYRISEGLVRTMGWRMQNCVRQQRLPQLDMGSEVTTALQVYMGVNAKGTPMAIPGLKR